jgi:hypothetical protein
LVQKNQSTFLPKDKFYNLVYLQQQKKKICSSIGGGELVFIMLY